MKGYSKFGEVGHDVPQWLQDLLIQFKKGLTPPPHPIGDKALLYNKTTGLVDWVSLGTAMSISSTSVVLATGATASLAIDEVLDDVWPIGGVFISINNVNPGNVSVLGFGTWSFLGTLTTS